jgi:hypothetical protein
MPEASHLRHPLQRLAMASLKNELLEIFAPARVPARPPAGYGAVEGLVVASVLSTAFWSLLAFTVSRCR